MIHLFRMDNWLIYEMDENLLSYGVKNTNLSYLNSKEYIILDFRWNFCSFQWSLLSLWRDIQAAVKFWFFFRHFKCNAISHLILHQKKTKQLPFKAIFFVHFPLFMHSFFNMRCMYMCVKHTVVLKVRINFMLLST